MGEKSRTEYSAINTTVALISRIIAILMGFVTRVVFTHVLNENYVDVYKRQMYYGSGQKSGEQE